jgi:phosphocarrier protein HPr
MGRACGCRDVSNESHVTAKIVNRLGLHARPAMMFVDVANTFKADIKVRKDDTEVNGKSIMEMMMLAAGQGSELSITANGDDAPAACAKLKELVDSGFDEE